MGQEYPADEAAKWGQQVDGLTRKLRGTVRAALSDAAARGFEQVPGPTMTVIMEATVEVKAALTLANQKIYQEGVLQIEKAVETDQKVTFGLAKLDFEAYKANLENDLEMAKAWSDMKVQERRAYIEVLKSDVDKRQAAIIEERALIEHEVNYWKGIAIEAESLSLDAEIELANAKVDTATAKMEIIQWLYKVIAAEQLIIAAEYKKAVALEKVLVMERALIEVKKTLIPLQKQKASGRIAQADAITTEAGYKKEIEELGYRRVDLKKAQDAAEHEVRLAEEDYEEARLDYTRADRQTEMTRAQVKTTMMDYENYIKGTVLDRHVALQKVETAFRHDYQHYWKKYELDNDMAYMDLGKLWFIKECYDKMKTIEDLATYKGAEALRTSAKVINKLSGSHMDQYIMKG